MKLFIINGENNDEKIEIYINEYLMVEDIKYKLDEILCGDGKFINKYYKLIYRNMILSFQNSIQYYKLCENDEIWFGKIENFLKKDDFIIDFFIVGYIPSDEYLIVKMNDTISTIRSIIERIHSEIINIWNADGKQMKNDQIVTEIGTNENYKLIIRCDDGEGNEINNTFDECCYLHDKYRVDRYLFFDEIRDDNKTESTRTILINLIDQIKQIISSNNTIDDRLNQNLSDLPSSFVKSINLFCLDVTDRIIDICNDYWRFVMNQYGNEVVKIVDQYFQFAIRAALWEYSDVRQHKIELYKPMNQYSIIRHENINKSNKSMRDVVIDAFRYFVKYLIDSSNDWRYWLRLFMNQYLLTSFNDSDLNERIAKCIINNYSIRMKVNGKYRNHFTTSNPNTVSDAKQSISRVYRVGMNHLYCINPGGDRMPNNEDKFEDKFIIEIVMSMDDIEILRSLGRGAFATIYLCRDKISNKQFFLKKPIQDGDLSRIINIYSKLDSARNIMNYSALFRYKDTICIGMEYMCGGSLRSHLDRGKHLSEQEIVKISYEILIQINELHKLGIIHQDITTDNIVIDEHNHAKLIGFVSSKYTIGLTSKDLLDECKGCYFGTICYMAPELIRGEPYSDQIDIWSFGMVMVEMVTCKRPFHWLAQFQIFPKISDCTKYEFEPIFPISNELNQFINACLSTNPDERPSAEQLIRSELFFRITNEAASVNN